MVNPAVKIILRDRRLSIDSDATAYINAVVAGGATVNAAQADAINNFFIVNKASGNWDTIKCLYLPVWGVASANSICVKTLSVGTWTGSVTHASGYVLSDGTTGHLRTPSNFSAEGLTPASSHLFTLSLTNNTINPAVPIGSGNINTCYSFASTTNLTFRWCTSAGAVGGATDRTGILTCLRVFGVRHIYRRVTAGSSLVTNATGADIGTTSVSPVYVLALNANDSVAGAASFFYDGQVGATGYGLGISTSAAEDFSLTLKNLWESVTGLVLP